MLLVQFGHWTLNMEYLVIAEDSQLEPPPKSLPAGIIRVLMEGRRPIDVGGEHADRLRRIIAELTGPYFVAADKPGRSVPTSRKPRKE